MEARVPLTGQGSPQEQRRLRNRLMCLAAFGLLLLVLAAWGRVGTVPVRLACSLFALGAAIVVIRYRRVA